MKKLLWNMTWLFVRPLLVVFFDFKISGKENYQRLNNPFIIVAAVHATFFDGYIIGASFHFNNRFFPIRYIMIEEKYFKTPIIGMIIKAYGVFMIKTGIGLENVLNPVVDLLKKGETVGMFIEGKLSKTGLPNEPKPGAAYLAIKTGLPVLPVSLSGNLGGFNPVKFFLKSRKISVSFGQPINPKDFGFLSGDEFDKEKVFKFTSIIMERIKDGLAGKI